MAPNSFLLEEGKGRREGREKKKKTKFCRLNVRFISVAYDLLSYQSDLSDHHLASGIELANYRFYLLYLDSKKKSSPMIGEGDGARRQRSRKKIFFELHVFLARLTRTEFFSVGVSPKFQANISRLIIFKRER